MKSIQDSTRDFLQKIKQRSIKSRIKYQFQIVGLEVAYLLDDQKNKSLYIKLAKQRKDYGVMLQLAKQIHDGRNIKNKAAYFMSILHK